MKKVKVTIQDEQTLVLQEDGARGDLIDLTSLHETDIDATTIKNVVNSIKRDAFESEINKVRQSLEREKSLELKAKQQELESQIDSLVKEKDAAVKLAEMSAKSLSQTDLARRDEEIIRLEAKLSAAETDKKFALAEAMQAAERELSQLKLEKKSLETEAERELSAQKEQYEDKLKAKTEEVDYYKDLKVKLSTKMLGETLEQHCEIEFERLRATAFQKATFGKDNDSTSGSKGDYIFRELDDDGNEIISIMFEMKNEGDTTATKKKNEDFLKELDKDRREKKCEYAVLVSLLESDSELYNDGIVDKSHRYGKMYVIRPQFFIPMITLLRNAALNSVKYRAELALAKAQNYDISKFEDDLQAFQDDFMSNVKNASNRSQEAIDGIDATIKKLESVKEALRLTNKHLLTAGNKVENVTIKKLTRDNPTMAEKFSDLRQKQSK